jgi:hypothetical protein
MVTVDDAAADPADPTRTPPPLCALTPRWLRDTPLPANPAERAQWTLTLTAAMEHQQTVRPCDPPSPPRRPSLRLDQLKATLLTALNPKVTVTARVRGQLTLPAGWNPADPLEPVLAAPEFSTPVYREVLQIDPELLLPAVGALPTNSVTSVGTNPWFIAAVMVGVNHEIGRELLWRGFPTDQRGTCFRNFWDRTGRQPQPGAADHDIPAITDWDVATPLHTHAAAGSAQTVILLRGELLRRYPRTTIYLTRAQRTQPDPAAPPEFTIAPLTGNPGDATYPEKYAIFSGELPPDIAFFGFNVKPPDAVGDGTAASPGYFLVLQEPPTEARFGLDDDRPATKPFHTWADLAWPDVTLTHDHIDLPATGGPTPDQPRGLRFNRTATSAQLAAATEQQPFRAAIHLSQLLPEEIP